MDPEGKVVEADLLLVLEEAKTLAQAAGASVCSKAGVNNWIPGAFVFWCPVFFRLNR